MHGQVLRSQHEMAHFKLHLMFMWTCICLHGSLAGRTCVMCPQDGIRLTCLWIRMNRPHVYTSCSRNVCDRRNSRKFGTCMQELLLHCHDSSKLCPFHSITQLPTVKRHSNRTRGKILYARTSVAVQLQSSVRITLLNHHVHILAFQ